MAAPMTLPLTHGHDRPRNGVALGDRLFVVGGKSLLLSLLVLAVLLPLLAIFWRGFSAEAGQGGGCWPPANCLPARTSIGCSATVCR